MMECNGDSTMTINTTHRRNKIKQKSDHPKTIVYYSFFKKDRYITILRAIRGTHFKFGEVICSYITKMEKRLFSLGTEINRRVTTVENVWEYTSFHRRQGCRLSWYRFLHTCCVSRVLYIYFPPMI